MARRNETFRPMLAASFENDKPLERQLTELSYPVICSPKYDGVRVLCHQTLGVVSRKLKPIKNIAMRSYLSDFCKAGLDGELMVGSHGKDYDFQATTSAVSSVDGDNQALRMVIFDSFYSPNASYHTRYTMLKAWFTKVRDLFSSGKFRLDLAPVKQCTAASDVLKYEEKCLADGFEGVMIRSVNGLYKYGRATLKEGSLIKLKRFEDAEAIIVGFEEMVSNQNEKTTNELGLSKRSGHKANLIPQDTLGAFLVQGVDKFAEFQFSVGGGKGLTQELRKAIWKNRDKFLGMRITYTYQNCGIKEKPRMPQFKNFRIEA